MTLHQSETLSALLATVIAKTRPDGMLKAAESAAAAFKAGLAVVEGAPPADLAPALLELVRAQTTALQASVGEQVELAVTRHFGGAKVSDLVTAAGQVADLVADKQRTLEAMATFKKMSDSSDETFNLLRNKLPAPRQDPPQKS